MLMIMSLMDLSIISLRIQKAIKIIKKIIKNVESIFTTPFEIKPKI